MFIGSCNVATALERAITTVERDIAELDGDLPPWSNPGRLGQYEACLAWSNDLERTKSWPTIAVPCLVLAFEHDVDSPPGGAVAEKLIDFYGRV